MSTQTHNASSFRSNISRGAFFSFAFRVPRAVAAVRGVVCLWLIALGIVLWTHGYPWGALLFVPAAVHLALAYRLLATTKAGQR